MWRVKSDFGVDSKFKEQTKDQFPYWQGWNQELPKLMYLPINSATLPDRVGVPEYTDTLIVCILQAPVKYPV